MVVPLAPYIKIRIYDSKRLIKNLPELALCKSFIQSVIRMLTKDKLANCFGSVTCGIG